MENLELLPPANVGRSWPHGERRAPLGKNMHTRTVPPLTPEMREYIARTLDDEYNEGISRGRALMRAEYERGEWIMFAIGVATGAAGALFVALRLFA